MRHSAVDAMPARPHPRDHRPHLASLVEDFRGFGPDIAVVWREGVRRRCLTYAQLAELAGRFARALETHGIHKGERVVIWGENSGPWLAGFWGCVLRGVIVVPIDISGATAFAERVIREVSPKWIAGNREELRLLGAEIPSIAFEDFAAALPKEPLYQPAGELVESDVLQIVFTSGTTGDPKGVVHTHHNILASFSPIEREIGKYLKYERPFHPLRLLVTPALSHVFGQFMGIWIPVLLAAEAHFKSRFIAGELMETIHRERISVLAAVPRVLELMSSDFELRFPELNERLNRAAHVSALGRWWMFRDVHRALGLKFWAVVSGGATLSEAVDRFWRSLGFVVVQGYGMTETSALVSLTHPFHPAPRATGANVGKVLPGREVRLGPDGEVMVKGDIISQATWEGGELKPRASPWLETGDLASIDESGNMRFRGRKKDVIVSASGLNIYPEDLEGALLRQPSIKAAAVVEVEGPRGGEPMAALVMRSAADPAKAVEAANAELAEYQQMRRWKVWPEPDLPRGSTGKILHRVVAEGLRDPRPAPFETAVTDTGSLAGLIAKITHEDVRNAPESARLSEDLHLDSLGRVELQSAIETRFGIELNDADYQQAKTLGELKRLLQAPISAPAAAIPKAEGTPPSRSETREEKAIQQSGKNVNLAIHPRADPHIYPTWPWSWPMRAVRYVFLEVISRPLVRLLAKPRVTSDLTEEPSEPVLIVANHVTAYDVPLILFGLPRGMRDRVAVAMGGEILLDFRKARNLGNPFLNVLGPFAYWLVTGLYNVFPLPQTSNFHKSFAHAGRAMDRGYHVIVFPEGIRTRDDRMHEFLGGSGILWKDLHAGALPVYLGGIAEMKLHGSRWFRSGRISVHVGKAIEPPQTGDPAAMTRELEKAVRELAE